MRVVLLAAAGVFSASLVLAGQNAAPPAAPAAPGTIAQAYEQFLLAQHLEGNGEVDQAIAAYTRAMAFDPSSADVVAELAGLYLRQGRTERARDAAQQALALDALNREANRVLGVIHAGLADNGQRTPRGGAADENVAKAIQHLEIAVQGAEGEVEPSLRATLARMYVAGGAYDKAIAMLTPLVNDEPRWSDGPQLLAEAYAGAGRIRDGIAWLEDRVGDDPRLLPTLADFYERERDWTKAADAYGRAIQLAPFGRNTNDLRTRYASVLLNLGGREAALKARDALMAMGRGAAGRDGLPGDVRALYLLSQAQRRLGDLAAADAAARAVITLNGRLPWGYYALAEVLEERGRYQDVADLLAPVMAQFRSAASDDSTWELSMLLPHLGFSYQQLGQYDKAIAIFEEARRLSPDDPTLSGYLVEANMAARNYTAAVAIARAAAAAHPDDLRLHRVYAQALRRSGKTGEAIAIMQDLLAAHAGDPSVHVALAGLYAEADRPADAIRVLQAAQARFPDDNQIAFQLGAIFDRQHRFSDAERMFEQVLARDPENAAALNYLGYMLAERGERLDESVDLISKALAIEPENGSYLDSLGWAYYKADKLDLAEDHLRRAAEQLKTSSVIQDHYGDVLFKLQKYDEAIAAWTRSLAGDRDSIDPDGIDRKIRTAKQRLAR
ncbi:MAG: tetratricopeptide repeat protein [Acidobacteria bacterium]|nr:tetratricopeptide repeat protein [Acidobacteriota bacterium]